MDGDYLFQNREKGTLYLAGLYESDESGSRYTILITKANACVDIHDRMPVMLRRDECRTWLHGKIDFTQISNRKNIVLAKRAV